MQVPFLRLIALFLSIIAIAGPLGSTDAFADDVAALATVEVNLDDAKPEKGAAGQDSAVSGTSKDQIVFPQGITVLPGLFTGGLQGSAVLIDDALQQVATISSSVDLDLAEQATISGFFASLHPLSDQTMHGLIAKRQPDGKNKTNYGINFHPGNDAFQVYVNDGTGFKVAVFPFRDVLGFRRRVHLSATFATQDAPGADSDSEKDDVVIRLYVNGKPATPVRVTAGFVEGTSAWLQDVQLSNCRSDTPLTVGASFVGGEYAKVICDQIRVFPVALDDAQAAGLFRESAGAEAGPILKEQSGGSAAVVPAPVITRASQYGLTIGQKNRLTLEGRNLLNGMLQFAQRDWQVTCVEGGKANSQTFDIDIPDTTLPGRYSARIVTEHGVSSPVVISIDRLPEFPVDSFSAEKPAETLPLAVSGMISGTEQKQVYLSGKAGQRIVAEVEARRLGSRLDPVVEIKTANGTPLAVQWQKPQLVGDTRAVAELPDDGIYFVEVHDLQFRAPGNSVFRLILGDLQDTSGVYPPAVGQGAGLRSVGENGVGGEYSIVSGSNGFRVDGSSPLTPLPALITAESQEVSEPIEGTFDEKPIDATMTKAPFEPLFVNGRIANPGEVDTFMLTVTSGQALRFEVRAREINSSLRPSLAIYQGEQRVAFSDGATGTIDPSLDYTVPKDVTQLTVRITDFTERGNPGAVYRCMVCRKDRPGFELLTDAQSLRLPANGSVPVQVQVVRQSPSFRYTGPIRLAPSGMDGVSIVPEILPASETNQTLFVTLTRRVNDPNGNGLSEGLSITGYSEGPGPQVSAILRPASGLPGQSQLTQPVFELPTTASPELAATLLVDGVPPILLRGIPSVLPVKLLPFGPMPAFVRFEMQTTESVRLSNPADPKSAPIPRVSVSEFQFGPSSQDVHLLRIGVPSEVADAFINAVISASFVDQPLQASGENVAWTAPVRFAVDDAVVVQPDTTVLKATKNSSVTLRGRIVRHPQFQAATQLQIVGLPKGYSASSANLSSTDTAFELSITTPDNAAVGEIPNLSLHAQSEGGAKISASVGIQLTIE
ncbi:MAG: hypothetical protein R3C20_06765 [Planctomycetaceae bacterium]